MVERKNIDSLLAVIVSSQTVSVSQNMENVTVSSFDDYCSSVITITPGSLTNSVICLWNFWFD